MTRDGDPVLRRFAALSRDDRAYVLGLLGQAEREALQLAMSDAAGTPLSPSLAALVDSCRSDDPPAELTEKAVAALLAAVDAENDRDPIDVAAEGLPPRRWPWSRSRNLRR